MFGEIALWWLTSRPFLFQELVCLVERATTARSLATLTCLGALLCDRRRSACGPDRAAPPTASAAARPHFPDREDGRPEQERGPGEDTGLWSCVNTGPVARSGPALSFYSRPPPAAEHIKARKHE